MDVLGRYELQRVVGRGGTGVVYAAVLRGPGGLRKPVAVKVMHGSGELLRREARIGGLLRHRHLVDVFEVGEHEGRWFCAMELCRGGSLAARGPQPPRAVVEVGLAVCSALQYAHETLGLVHLDLKPDNLLVDEGEIKVADLGVARAEGFSGDGRVRGTPGYMPPEQARGGAVDARADVYALGVTLVELATGRRPRAGATLDLDRLDLDPDAPDGAVPGWLAPAVGRCLAPEPDDRWPSIAALALALAALPVDGPGLREALGAPAGIAAPSREPGGPSTALVGRTVECARLLETLEEGPGLTVLRGAPGIGKSRLAWRAAEHWTRDRGRVSRVVDLAEARDAEGLVYAVASALALLIAGGTTEQHVERLGRALGAHDAALLVLDTFEHLAGAAPILRTWCALAPTLRIVVTTRAALPIPAERTLELGPLAVRDAADLLVARARERGVDLAHDPHVEELVRRLEGVPLALELAAGRLGVLSVSDVLDRLGLALLRRGTDDRHGTLGLAIGWSWELLSPTERAALAQLSVFAGGFTAELAEDVLELGGASVLDVLVSLADRSMIAPSRGGWLAMPYGVREYAAHELGTDAEGTVRHGRALARRCAPEALAMEGGRVHETVFEVDNFVAACERAVARGDADVAVATLRGAWAIQHLRGPYPVAERLAGSVLALEALTPVQRFQTERIRGMALRLMGRTADALPCTQAALALARAIGDRSLEALAHADCGWLSLDAGRAQEAEAHLGAALQAHAVAGARRRVGTTRMLLGNVRASLGRLDEATQHYTVALAVAREIDAPRLEGVVLTNLGTTQAQEGRAAAQASYEAALALHRAVGHRRFEALTLTNLAFFEVENGDPDVARACLDAAFTVNREAGDRGADWLGLVALGALHQGEGRLDDAERTLQQAFESARREARARGTVLLHLAALHRDRGRLAEAKARLDEALEAFHALGDPRTEGLMLAAHARLWADHPHELRAVAERASALLEGMEDPRVAVARAGLAAGQAAADPAAARAAIEAATRWRPVAARGLVAMLLAAAAEVRVALGDERGARAALREAEAIAPRANVETRASLDRARMRLG